MNPRRRLATTGVALAVLLMGCDPDPTPQPTGDNIFTAAYAEARAAGASTAQLDALAKAAESGEMEYGELVVLVEDTLTCLEKAGLPYQPISAWERWPGFFIPMYGMGEIEALGREGSYAITTECERKYSGFAYEAYESQPSAQEARDERFRADLPATLACLAENGYDLPEDATLNEVRAAVSDLAIESSKSGMTVLCSEWAY